MTPQAMRLPALPVFAVSVVAAGLFGVYWVGSDPTGMLPRLSEFWVQDDRAPGVPVSCRCKQA
jgi:hypothetical protein